MGKWGLAMIIHQLVQWVGFPCIKEMCSFHDVAFNKKHPLDRLMTIYSIVISLLCDLEYSLGLSVDYVGRVCPST